MSEAVGMQETILLSNGAAIVKDDERTASDDDNATMWLEVYLKEEEE